MSFPSKTLWGSPQSLKELGAHTVEGAVLGEGGEVRGVGGPPGGECLAQSLGAGLHAGVVLFQRRRFEVGEEVIGRVPQVSFQRRKTGQWLLIHGLSAVAYTSLNRPSRACVRHPVEMPS